MNLKSMISFVFLFLFSTMALAAPGDGVVFIDFPPFNTRTNAKWGPALKDIMNHEAPGDSNPYSDLVTLGHETSHGIHAYIRNKNYTPGKKINAFYVLNDRAVIVEEPRMRKSQIAAFVPANLRGSRYALYVTGQTSWDDRPLYIWDEWNAYVNGAEVGVDLVEQNLWTYGWRDAVWGPVEFVVYALATAMAVQRHDPTYFSSNVQFREFLAWNIERSMRVFFRGRDLAAFTYETQNIFYSKFQTSAEALAMRHFVKDMYGDEWVSQVLGF